MTNKKHTNSDVTDPKRDQESLAADTTATGTKSEAANAQITSLDKKLLKDSFDPSYDVDLPVGSISLDDKDNDGELLNESGMSEDLFGKDLDGDLIQEEDEEDGN